MMKTKTSATFTSDDSKQRKSPTIQTCFLASTRQVNKRVDETSSFLPHIYNKPFLELNSSKKQSFCSFKYVLCCLIFLGVSIGYLYIGVIVNQSRVSLGEWFSIVDSSQQNYFLEDSRLQYPRQVLFLESDTNLSPLIGRSNIRKSKYIPDRQFSKDHGGLIIIFQTSHNAALVVDREISEAAYYQNEVERSAFLKQIDEKLNEKYYSKDDLEDEEQECISPDWMSLSFPTCNNIHEVTIHRAVENSNSMQEYNITYLSHGKYRDAWRMHRSNIINTSIVYKRYMLKVMMSTREHDALYKAHQEATIMERLTSSPRILDIYSYCGSTVLVENMVSSIDEMIIPGEGLASQAELNALEDVTSQNNLTDSEKLKISLTMAESVMDLHDYKDGIIVHSDIDIEQFLLATDGKIKLNDFNYAYALPWNNKKERYCYIYRQHRATYRSPEEYSGDRQDETKDTYVLANSIYSVLTGLDPFYDEIYRGISDKKILDGLLKGKRPFIDNHYRSGSYIERSLVDIIERCWDGRREKRPRISEVVSFLRKVKTISHARRELEPSSWIEIPIP